MMIAGIFQGLVLVILLLRKEVNQLPNRLLAAFILLISLHLILVRAGTDNLFLDFPRLRHVTYFFPALYGPLLLLFVSSIAEVEFRFRRRHLILLVPLLVIMGWLIPYFLEENGGRDADLADLAPEGIDQHGLLDEVSNLIYMGFAAAALLVFYQRRKRLYRYFSNPSRIRPAWLEQFLLVVLGVITLSVASFYSKAYGLPNFPEVYPYHLALLVILVYWIGFELVQDPTVFTADEPEDGQDGWDGEEVQNDGSDPAQDPLTRTADSFPPEVGQRKALAEQLREYMDEFKPYLNANLTLNDLSSELQITRRQLSEVISQEFNSGFFEFINGYRIREFRREVDLGLNRHLSLLGMAMNCGFTSCKNFKRTFKQFEGIPPAAYMAGRTSGQV